MLVRNDDPAGQPIRVRQGDETLLDRVLGPREAVPILARAGDSEPVRFEAGGDSTGAAFVLRADNPFAGVTDSNGAFALGDVPSGRYTLEVWDDALGTRVVEVNVPMAQPLMVVFSAGTPPCRIAKSGPDAGPIGAACQKGGIIEAKRAMKDLVKRAKANGHRFRCDDCHRDLDSFLLLDGAREDLARLVGSGELTPAGR